MARLANSFDGGTNGVAVTSGNSGGASGDAFDDVTVGGVGTIVYDNVHVPFAGTAVAINPDATHTAYLGYTSLGTLTTVFGRAYVNFPALPAATQILVLLRDSGTSTNCGSISVLTDGRLRLADALGVALSTSTSVLTAGSTARLEWRFVGNVLTGVVEVKIFLTPNSTTPTETVTATGANTRGSFDRFRIGQNSAIATDLGVFYLDEIVWDTVAYPGPEVISVAPGLIDQSGALFTPKANRRFNVGLITQSPTLFTPNVRRGVNVPLLNASAQLFAPGQSRTVGSTSAFQNDAFQNDAFQTGQVFFIHADPVLFTPKLNQTITMPATGSGSGGAFQTDAFQADAFQTGGGAGPTIDASGVVYTPSSVTQGLNTVAPTFLDASGVLFAPTVLSGVFVPLLDVSGVLFAPSLPAQGQFVYMDGGQGWDSSQVFWDGTTLWDASGVGGNIDQSPQLFTPSTVGFSVTVPLLDASAQLFAPSPGASSINVGLINASGFLFTPSVATNVLPALLDASPELFDWAIQTTQQIEPDVLDASGVLYAPSVNPQDVGTPLINASGIVFTPALSQNIEVPLIDASGVVFDPFIGPVIFADLIDASPEVFLPSLERVFLDLLDASGVVFEPFVNLPFAQTIRLDDSILQFIDASPELFSPSSIDVAQPQTITFFTLIDASGIVFAPRVFIPTRPVIRLRARYMPIINKRAKYDPVITKRAQLARQG